MSFQMSEIEYFLIDYLADGALPLSELMRELHEGKPLWERGMVITALVRLMEKQLIRSNRIPGGPSATELAPEMIPVQLAGIGDHPAAECWMELTEHGQAVWEVWRQASYG